MKTMNRIPALSPLLRLLLPAIMLLCMAAVADACPNCGAESMAKQKGGPELVQGFTYSMVGMASMPFLLFGSVAFYIIRTYRKRQEGELEGFDDPGMPG